MSIKGINKVVIGVRDQERARTFWTATMGFALVQDAQYGDERWLEVRSPDGATDLILELNPADVDHRSAAPDALPTSNVMFSCDDLATTYAELSARGVQFPQSPIEQSFGWWSMFADTEGNRFALSSN
jgi:predicted enzyme related to lactoylglutathione lyase